MTLFFLFLNETFRTIRREFPQIANTMLNISIIFPYSAFPPGWNSHVLIQSQSLHLYRGDYLSLLTYAVTLLQQFFPLPFKTSNLYLTELFTSALKCYFSHLKQQQQKFTDPILLSSTTISLSPLQQSSLKELSLLHLPSIPPVLSQPSLINQAFTHYIKVTNDLPFVKSKGQFFVFIFFDPSVTFTRLIISFSLIYVCLWLPGHHILSVSLLFCWSFMLCLLHWFFLFFLTF